MIIFNKVKKTLGVLYLLATLESSADVLVDVSATMVDPICNIRSENSSSPLKIGFGTLSSETVNKLTTVKNFSIYISDCNFSKSLALVLNPKGGNTLSYNGKNILATSINGLGIDFNEVTDGNVRGLELNKMQRIYPQQINTTLHRLDMQAQLVSTVPTNELNQGKFTSTVTLSVTYN